MTFKRGMSRVFLGQGIVLRYRQIQTRMSPKAGPPKAALSQLRGAGGKLVSGAGTPTSLVKLQFLSTGNKDSVFQWEVPLPRRENFWPELGI